MDSVSPFQKTGVREISPDSSRVVYIIEWVTSGTYELYSVPIVGPAASGIKLNGVLVAGGDVGSFQISPDSRRVVFRGDRQTAGVDELFSVPLAGPASALIEVNGPLAPGGDVGLFQISPDGGRVIYIADQDTNDLLELYMTSYYSIHLPLILNE